MDPRARPRITKIMQDPVFSDVRSGELDDPLALRQDPTWFGSARRYREQGDVAFRREAYKEAVDYYEQARRSFERMGDTRRTALCLRDLGWTHIRLGKHDLARAHFGEARELCRSMVDLRAELDTVQDLAAAERSAGNLELSRAYLEHAFEDCRRAGLHVRSGWCLVATGLLDVDIEDWRAAHWCFDTAAEIATQQRSQGLLARSRERQGDCYVRQEMLSQARRCYDAAAVAYRSLPVEEDQVQRVERKIQGCHRIRHEDIAAMPLWGIGDLPSMGDGMGLHTV
ncbi:hypothetical protein FRC10_008912 [Ceratobasidium sp. 414]|nr:hypothetical protein FRC10_008912 [Ceratobasidium sp. 414]